MEIRGVEGMIVFAREALGKMIEHKHEGALVVGLVGDLGSGKTTFVQCVAKELNVAEPATSPTFVILKNHKVPGHAHFKKIAHIDVYRLDDDKELDSIKWNSLIQEEGTVVFVEWAGKVKGRLPEDALEITFEVTGDETRDVEIHGN